MRRNEEMFNAFFASKLPLYLAHHDYVKLGEELPISGDGIVLEDKRKKDK